MNGPKHHLPRMIGLSIIGIIAISFLSNCIPAIFVKSSFQIIGSDQLPVVWSLNNVEIRGTRNHPSMFASEDGLLILGKLQDSREAIYEFDPVEETYQQVTTVPAGTSSFLLRDGTIYLASANRIMAQTQEGSPLWETILAEKKPITWMHIEGDFLTIQDNARKISVLDIRDGRKLYSFFLECSEFWALWKDKALTTCLSNGIGLVNTQDYVADWEVPLASIIEQAPILFIDPDRFTYSVLIKSRNSDTQQITSIDFSTGRKLWENKSGFISNIVLFKNQLIGITENGILQTIDPYTGDTKNLLSIATDQPFSSGQIQAVYVAMDETTNRLYLYIDRYRQLYAFEISDGL